MRSCDIILDGMPITDGLYPLASSNELSNRFPENRLDRKAALATMTLMGAVVFSSFSLHRMDLII